MDNQFSVANDLRIENLSLQYESDLGTDRFAVQGLTLTVPQNQIWCLVGKSGCGKSSLIRMIAGLEKPTTGRITVGGVPVSGRPSADRVMVFQEDAVFPWMTVYQNIEYPSKVAGLPKRERRKRTMRFIEMVGLTEYAHAWPKELSGGMRKRVDVARAYPLNPKILLMDEPFGALDVMTKGQLQLALLDLLSSEPKTTIFVTHDLEEAIFLGDVVLVMDKGRVAAKHSVPFPRPRPETLKSEPQFITMRDSIARELHDRTASND